MASIPGRELQEEFLALTRKSQDVMVHAIKTWVDTVRTVKLPSGYPPVADGFARLRTIGADRLRTPEEAVASAYRLAEQLLDCQRKFARDLLKATVPLMQGASTPQDHAEPQDHADPQPTQSAKPATRKAPRAKPAEAS
jgi:hypothetical protein